MKRLMNVMSVCAVVAMLVLTGCEDDAANVQTPAAEGAATPLPAESLLSESPGEATPITQLKQSAKEGDTVVIRAKVGGDVKPFVPGRAVMMVVDATLPQSCGVRADDPCTTPWDYCCTMPDELRPHMATVQLVDAEGRPLKVDLGNSPSVKPLDTIVVRGKVGPRPDDATLVVNADAIYVEGLPGGRQ